VGGGGGGGGGGGTADNAFPTAVARVMRQSLSSQTQVSATLTYAGASSVVVPAGTPPSDVLQAQQSVTTAEGMLASDSATLAADSQTLAELQAGLAAAEDKQAVDCAGVNAAQPASSGSGAGGASASPCGSDEQTVSTDQQSLTQDQAKVAGDRTQLSSAQRSLAGAQESLSVAEASGAVYGQSSTYTTLPALGAVMRRGQSLYAVSGQPVVLLYGSAAPWRAFAAGMSPGRDVAELNANLEALGYGKRLTGDVFSAATTTAIDAFQTAHGLSATGELLLGSVVFEPGAVRVTGVTPTVGQTVQAGAVLAVTSTVRQVQIALDAAEQSEVKAGDPVTITLPDNSTTPGRVSYVGTVATTPSASDQGGGGPSTPTIEVYVAPDDPAATGDLDQVPVDVSITTASVENVLVVPVDGLLALASGGYALEEISSNGTHHLVAVSLGLFDDADGLVQVSGAGLAAGQRVVVPNI
jgi:peptidoglycan hydrolase-like protein with peptidoglycan-binding domain